MGMAERLRKTNGDAQEAGQIERLRLIPLKYARLKNPIHRLTTRVAQDQQRASFMTRKRKWLGCPFGIELRCE